MHCYLMPFVAPIVLGFYHEAGFADPQCTSVSNLNSIGQCMIELLMICSGTAARVWRLNECWLKKASGKTYRRAASQTNAIGMQMSTQICTKYKVPYLLFTLYHFM